MADGARVYTVSLFVSPMSPEVELLERYRLDWQDCHGNGMKFLAAPITCVSRWAAHRELEFYMVWTARYHGVLGSGMDVFVHHTFVHAVRDRARWLMRNVTMVDIRVYGYRYRDDAR
jgi:hypothetical protein